MTVQIIITADNAADALYQLTELAGNTVTAGSVTNLAVGPLTLTEEQAAKSSAKVEASEPDTSEQGTAIAVEVEQQKEKAKPAAKKGAAAAKTAKGPSEEALRDYIATAAAYFLNDEEEAPKLDKMLKDFVAETLEEIEADDLAGFAKVIFETGNDIFEGFPAVPKK